MPTAITEFSRFTMSATLLAIFAVPLSSSNGQSANWTNPVSGFYEFGSNWTPTGVPAQTDVVIFDQAGEYEIGFQLNHEAAGLAITDDADIGFNVAGADTSDRLYQINGDAVINDARLRLQGNDLGPRMSLELEDNLDLLGEGNALRIVDNASLRNQSTLMDLDGNVVVSGTLASWNMSGELTLRNGAFLSVTDGGLVEALGTTIVGGTSSTNPSDGSIFVSGSGSDGQPASLILGEELFLANFGTSRLFVRDGGFARVVESLQVARGSDSSGIILVDGVDAMGNRSVLETGLITLGRGGTADLTIRAGGLVRSESATVGSDSPGDVEIEGGALPAEWIISGGLRIGATGSGRVEVRDGGRLESTRTFLGFSPTLSGSIRVIGEDAAEPTSTWVNHENVFVAGNDDQPFGSASVLVSDNARADIGGTFRIWEEGFVTIRQGARFSADTIENTRGGGFDLLSQAILHVNRFEGDLLNPSGVLAPGVDETAGTTTIFGDYTQESDALLSLGIGGTSPGGTHDLVSVTGDADIDGMIELSLIDGFTPDGDDIFTVFAATTLFGSFDNVSTGQRLDTIDGRGSFVVNYGIGSPFNETRIVLSNFEAAPTPGDFDLDGDVDGSDFLAWQRNPSVGNLTDWQDNFGARTATLSASKVARAVPEPTTIMSLLLGVVISSCLRHFT